MYGSGPADAAEALTRAAAANQELKRTVEEIWGLLMREEHMDETFLQAFLLESKYVANLTADRAEGAFRMMQQNRGAAWQFWFGCFAAGIIATGITKIIHERAHEEAFQRKWDLSCDAEAIIETWD